jgi:hypothetical protein
MNTDTEAAHVEGRELKLNWGFTFLIGLGFFGIEVLWRVYNNFVPIYLQSGNPTFDVTQEDPILGYHIGTDRRIGSVATAKKLQQR